MNQDQQDRYRRALVDMRDRLSATIDRMSEVILTDDQPPGEHDRQVSEGIGKEIALEHEEEAIYRQVLAALQRLAEGRFGSCQECGQPISRERLDAIPYARFCIACEQRLERA